MLTKFGNSPPLLLLWSYWACFCMLFILNLIYSECNIWTLVGFMSFFNFHYLYKIFIFNGVLNWLLVCFLFKLFPCKNIPSVLDSWRVSNLTLGLLLLQMIWICDYVPHYQLVLRDDWKHIHFNYVNSWIKIMVDAIFPSSFSMCCFILFFVICFKYVREILSYCHPQTFNRS